MPGTLDVRAKLHYGISLRTNTDWELRTVAVTIIGEKIKRFQIEWNKIGHFVAIFGNLIFLMCLCSGLFCNWWDALSHITFVDLLLRKLRTFRRGIRQHPVLEHFSDYELDRFRNFPVPCMELLLDFLGVVSA